MWANNTKVSSQSFKLDPLSDTTYLVPPEPPLSEAELAEIINAPSEHIPPKEHRIFDLPSAPVFYPTEGEFKDPASYIESIREEGEKFGICKVVPPPSFQPRINPRFKEFTFNTRKQEIGTIGISGYYNRLYIFNLRTFHKQIGNQLRFPPIIDGNEIDLYELKLVVERQGGYSEVSTKKKWIQVANALDCGLKSSGEEPHRLEKKYQAYILPYEKHIANADQFKFSTQNEKRCCVCRKGGEKLPLMACKHCKVSAHANCIQFSHKIMPPEEWLCLSCINARELEFDDGPTYSLAEFGGKAAQLRRRLLENVLANNPVVPHVSLSTMTLEEVENVIEKLYWQLVNDVYTDVSVDYGADLTSLDAYGGFPLKGFGPWNLNELPVISASLFSHLKEGISGMTAPWAYIGMILSTFCWHTEDHYTYSINYHHWGATKTWYGIPASHSLAFEASFKRQEAKLFQTHPDLLSHLSFTLCPDALRGVSPVYALDQRPGEFVITFPRAYHAGFNHGLNFNEAANFAPADWLPYGLECLARYRKHGKIPVFSHHELMFLATTTKDLRLAENIIPHAEEAIAIELDHRIDTLKFVPVFKEPATWAVVQCLLCNAYCYFSHVACECSSNTLIFCLDHAAGLKVCNVRNHVLIKTVKRPKMVRAVSRLKDFVGQWAPWMERYNKLQTQVPTLAELDQLANETNNSGDAPLAVAQFLSYYHKCCAWEEKCRQLLADVRNRTTAGFFVPEDIMALAHQNKELNFQSVYADKLFSFTRELDSLCQSAIALVSSPSATLNQATELQERIWKTGIELLEGRQVDYLVKKLTWCQEASNLLSTTTYSPESAEALLSRVPNQTCPRVASLVSSLKEFLQRKPPVALTLTSPTGPVLVNREEHERALALGRSLLQQAKNPSFAARPPISRLDALLRYFQGLNCNDALLSNLDYARLQVGVWRNETHAILSNRNLSVITLVKYFSRLLATTEKASAMTKGSRSCICFKDTSDDSMTCMVCKVAYHPACCKLALFGHGYICYICGPIKQLSESEPRIEHADLGTILLAAQKLPFIPGEYRLIEEISKHSCAIVERISTLLATSPPLELIKNHFRLLEGLSIKVKITETLWDIIKRTMPPLSFDPLSANNLFDGSTPGQERQPLKRTAPSHSHAECFSSLQSPNKIHNAGSKAEAEASRALPTQRNLNGSQGFSTRGVAQPAAHQPAERAAERSTEVPHSADQLSSNLFSVESLVLTPSSSSQTGIRTANSTPLHFSFQLEPRPRATGSPERNA